MANNCALSNGTALESHALPSEEEEGQESHGDIPVKAARCRPLQARNVPFCAFARPTTCPVSLCVSAGSQGYLGGCLA